MSSEVLIEFNSSGVGRAKTHKPTAENPVFGVSVDGLHIFVPHEISNRPREDAIQMIATAIAKKVFQLNDQEMKSNIGQLSSGVKGGISLSADAALIENPQPGVAFRNTDNIAVDVPAVGNDPFSSAKLNFSILLAEVLYEQTQKMI